MEKGAAMKAADCTTMAEIRAEIDRLDAELVALFAQRVGYIDRAAAIMTLRAPSVVAPPAPEPHPIEPTATNPPQAQA